LMSLAVSAATQTITPTHISCVKMRTRKRKKGTASYRPDPKKAGTRNSLSGTRATGHTSFVEIRLVSSGINWTRSNMSRPSPISRI
jgi:hypothetical protein